jgi:hypothetical protein
LFNDESNWKIFDSLHSFHQPIEKNRTKRKTSKMERNKKRREIHSKRILDQIIWILSQLLLHFIWYYHQNGHILFLCQRIS